MQTLDGGQMHCRPLLRCRGRDASAETAGCAGEGRSVPGSVYGRLEATLANLAARYDNPAEPIHMTHG